MCVFHGHGNHGPGSTYIVDCPESCARPLSSGLTGAGNHTAWTIGVRIEAAMDKYIYLLNR